MIMKRGILFLVFLMTKVSISNQKSNPAPSPSHYYYIYNLNVLIPTYYCFYEKDYDCTKFRNSSTVENCSQAIKDSCKTTWRQFFVQAYHKVKNFGNLELTICNVSTAANLLDGTVALSRSQICRFEKEHCFDENAWKGVSWKSDNISNSISLLYKGNFHECQNKYGQTFIYNEQKSLLLTKKFELSHETVWKTDYKGILVSKNSLGGQPANISHSFASIPPEGCQLSNITKKSVPSKWEPRKWYIYEYPTNVTVTYCAIDASKSCEEMGFTTQINATVKKNCYDHFCDTSCKSDKLSINLCSSIQGIYLEKDEVMQLPPTCKYSKGICNEARAFWEYKDSCTAIRKTFEGEEREHMNNTIFLNNSEELTLLRNGTLCGYNVWFTYQNDGGQFATTKLLDLVEKNESPSDDSSEIANVSNSVSSENKEEKEEAEEEEESEKLTFYNQIIDLQRRTYCLMIFLVICFLYYLFNVIVNFFTLRKFSKMGIVNKKPCYMSCWSQSLTTRYISLSRLELNENGAMQGNKLYETVENELYNK